MSENLHAAQTQQCLNEWDKRIELAEQMLPLIGKLYREHKTVISVYGRSLVGKSPLEIVGAHRFARKIDGQQLSLVRSLQLLERLLEQQPASANIDLAKMQRNFETVASVESCCGTYDEAALQEYVEGQLSQLHSLANEQPAGSADVVLYGFGRIGRLLARILIDQAGSAAAVNLRAVVVRKSIENDLEKRANLLRRDSVHGRFRGTIEVDGENNVIIANGTRIQVIYANDPASVDYEQYGIRNAIVVDNTGRWRDEEGLSQHLRARGVSKVLLTAPGKGEVKNIVFGINEGIISGNDQILSAASCTTNAITPVLKVMNDKFGIRRGHVETVHSYTNDQNLIDNFHKGDRRGRSAALNMVITETGAAKAVAKALPEFAGKLTGTAIRVPTPDVSLAILNLQLEKSASREEINAYLKDISLTSNLRAQIDYIESPEIVSSDFVGANRTGIVDGLATISSGESCVLYVWYDNEYGYSCQVIRVVEHLAGKSLTDLPIA